jgi:hypothetical protein
MPLSDDLNRTRLKRRIDELHVDVRRLQRPQERHQALKELDQLTVEYIRALCTEMKYVFQQSALLQEELQPDPEPALATEELLEPLMLQETYREVVERLGWSQPNEQRPEVPVILPEPDQEEEISFESPQDLRYYVEVQIEDWGSNRDRFALLEKMTLEVPLWQEWVEEYRAEKSPKVRHPGIEGRCTVEIGKLLGVQPALISVQVLKCAEGMR